ncbi:putative bacteriophage protein [Burkholderia sp. 8Y]|uniref:Gp138 family membrane-puncturing spike protein n=1 Tax=Burkholderia sp. 8Y TaxID=2653133 RepID=UPI0012F0C595|nr:Gp138 family membrane-puncturing spike protein [Burkholderia sp. 8Y]VXB25424.1 putative bacteriophage protein [Burkholderia sp. 8Y]
MLQTERSADLEEALRAALGGHQTGIWTALPAIIQSFDANALTCTAQPAIQAQVRAQDGSTAWVSLPLLVDVPVCFPRGGNCTLTFPIAKDDEALIVFASRCIDAWWQSGGVQVQAELRMHDLSDGFAIPGPFSQATKISGVSTSTTQLRSNDGSTFVDLDPSGQVVKVKAPGGITLDTPAVTITGVINVENVNGASTAMAISGNTNFSGQVSANGKRIDDTHTHGGVQTGSGNTAKVN